ncbi:MULTISPECIES: HPr family phosphocarrier protein [Clostridium]|uniref:HPr family phosphocarrier protein n=1 Tax=Clostridium TaxID=1485 RepID=UPI00069D376F|nr:MULTISPECIES: HPr family phosphocarrier protein [Clostridium]KOF58216.1 PTS sugar transporter subunit IIA [Clostridium sp. DMHC 10]MCD2346365.1 HPr family phosphocarrier protein [Clostridium guangxiense]
MVFKNVVIKNKLGLHARVVTLVVKKASGFKSDIFIEFNGKKADSKSIINVLALGANCGAQIKITASGPDEALALDEMAAVFDKE